MTAYSWHRRRLVILPSFAMNRKHHSDRIGTSHIQCKFRKGKISSSLSTPLHTNKLARKNSSIHCQLYNLCPQMCLLIWMQITSSVRACTTNTHFSLWISVSPAGGEKRAWSCDEDPHSNPTNKTPTHVLPKLNPLQEPHRGVTLTPITSLRHWFNLFKARSVCPETGHPWELRKLGRLKNFESIS